MSSPYRGSAAPRTFPAAGVWFFGGVLAAGLGLAVITVPVLLLWIISPYPDSGAGGALHVAADLWLLGHGADLVRDGSLGAAGGAGVPVGLTPLLLALLPARLLYRAMSQGLALGEEQRRLPGDSRGTLPAVGWLGCGYLLAGGAAVAYAAQGPLHVEVLSAVRALPLFVGCAGAAAVCVRRDGRGAHGAHGVRGFRDVRDVGVRQGRPAPGLARRALAPRHLLPAARAAAVVSGVLCGGGFLLVAGALAAHGNRALAALPELTDGWSGRFALVLLALTLLPNAAVWGAAYVLGPGFTLGAASTVAPLTASAGHPHLPPFPLLAAVPEQGADGMPVWVLAPLVAVPLLAGLAGGWSVGRRAVPEPGRRAGSRGWRQTLHVAGLAAGVCGAAIAVLSAFAGGALGTGVLARLGPSGWLTGAAAVAWTALLAPPVALVVRAWRLAVPAWTGLDEVGLARGRAELARELDPADPYADDPCADGVRHTRWAALKESSGGLMTDFAPHREAGREARREPYGGPRHGG